MTTAKRAIDVAEAWRPVVGWDDLYEVCNLGLVKSKDRDILLATGRTRSLKGRVLAPGSLSSGHLVVGLLKRGRQSTRLIHRLVAEAFIPNPDNLPLVLHWDDDPQNNHVSNLRWGTHSDNLRDLVRNGRHPMAGKTHCPQGHEYSDGNTYLYGGRRTCRTCTLRGRHVEPR